MQSNSQACTKMLEETGVTIQRMFDVVKSMIFNFHNIRSVIIAKANEQKSIISPETSEYFKIGKAD